MLVRNELRAAFVEPELCPQCLSLGGDERKAVLRRALGDLKRRETRDSLRRVLRSSGGRDALKETSRARFLAAASTLFRAPDRDQIDEQTKLRALTRVAGLGGDQAVQELRSSLAAVGTDAGRIAGMLANEAIRDDQARKVSRALAKLAAGGSFPKGLAVRLRTGGLGMTTAMAGTRSAKPHIAQAAAYEIYAAAKIADNPTFPYPFRKGQIASFHYRFQHNRYASASRTASYEGDIVIDHGNMGKRTFVDFKHSTVGRPYVTEDNLERIFHGLTRGEIDRAVVVSNSSLTQASNKAIADFNERLEAWNQQSPWDKIPPIRTVVQGW